MRNITVYRQESHKSPVMILTPLIHALVEKQGQVSLHYDSVSTATATSWRLSASTSTLSPPSNMAGRTLSFLLSPTTCATCDCPSHGRSSQYGSDPRRPRQAPHR